MVSKKAIPEILKIIYQQHKNVFKAPMCRADKKSLLTEFRNLFNEGSLFFKQETSGEIAYFFCIKKNTKSESGEEIVYISHCFCNNNAKNRKKLCDLINDIATKAKNDLKIKQMVVCIYHNDIKLKKYFEIKGKLTAIELVGKTTFGLKVLSREAHINPKTIKISRLQAKDILKLTKLEKVSHLSEATSRMRDMFATPNAHKMISNFYKRLLRKKSCYVIRKNNELAGSISFLLKKDSNMGFVSSIFVANKFKGQGLSKLLYKKLLEEFSKRNFPNYIGSTTTDKVLGLGKKLGRKEFRSVYIVKI